MNPIKVIGLNPGIFKGIHSTKSREEVIKSVFRTLVKIHHPDTGGKTLRFREIQEAMTQFENNPEAILKDFMKPSREKVNMLQAQLDLVTDELEEQKFQFYTYLQELTKQGGIEIPYEALLLHDTLTGISNEAIRTENTFSPQKFIVFRIENRRLVSRQIMKPYKDGTNLSYLDFGEHLIGDSWVHVGGKTEEKKGWTTFKPVGKAEGFSVAILGTIPLEAIENLGSSPKDLLSLEGSVKGPKIPKDFDSEQLSTVLPELIPSIKKNSLLIGGRIIQNELRYLILGKITYLIHQTPRS